MGNEFWEAWYDVEVDVTTGRSETCENWCRENVMCVGYMTRGSNRCEILQFTDENSREGIGGVDSQQLFKCWRKTTAQIPENIVSTIYFFSLNRAEWIECQGVHFLLSHFGLTIQQFFLKGEAFFPGFCANIHLPNPY